MKIINQLDVHILRLKKKQKSEADNASLHSFLSPEKKHSHSKSQLTTVKKSLNFKSRSHSKVELPSHGVLTRGEASIE